jgi:hypothetical protein
MRTRCCSPAATPEADEQFARYLSVERGPHGAEWRIKHACLSLIRERGGDRQLRDPEQAELLLEPVDLVAGSISPADALKATEAALNADACCGEAWFRFALVSTVIEEAIEGQVVAMLTAAALLRTAPGAWLNAIIAAALHSSDAWLSDLMLVAYQSNGAEFVDAMVEAAAQLDDRAAAQRLLGLLDKTILTWDELDLQSGYVIRLNSDDGTVREVVVGDDPWGG